MKSLIMHISSAHDMDDPRIFYRHCSSLHEHNYKIIYSGPFKKIKKNQMINNIEVIELKFNNRDIIKKNAILTIPISKYSNRILRFTLGNFFLLKNVFRVKPAIVEFHDPDLVFVGLVLRIFGYKVIANIHEDIADQILNKFWIPYIFRFILSKTFKIFYPMVLRLSSDARIFATDHIKKKYSLKNSIVTRNFPTKNFIKKNKFNKKPPVIKNKLKLIYVGVLEERRGLKFWNNIAILDQVEEIHLVGKFSPKESERQFTKKYLSNKKIFIHGQRDYRFISNYIDMCDLGICLIETNPAYYYSLPTKVFEYISRNKPVITNNFPEVKKLLKKFPCCIFLDDVDTEIERAINKIIANYHDFYNSCLNASKELNWENEKLKYLKLINEII